MLKSASTGLKRELAYSFAVYLDLIHFNQQPICVPDRYTLTPSTLDLLISSDIPPYKYYSSAPSEIF